MKKADHKVEIIERCPRTRLLNDRHRQSIINNIAVKVLSEYSTEEEALGMFFWKLADLDPPVSREEQLLFHALYLVHQSSQNIKIENKEEALEILGILEKLDLPKEELIKEAKIAYWHGFNILSNNFKHFLKNAHEIGIKKSAFDFLCHL